MTFKRIELHLHLDGSLRPSTVAELSGRVDLDKIREELTVSDNDKTLVDYLKKFDLANDVMQSEDNLERVAYELVEDLAKENTIYTEIRFAPIAHMKEGLSPEEIVNAVLRGFRKAEDDYPIKANLLICAMRHLGSKKNNYLLDLAEKYRDNGVVGLDLAGDEAGYPVTDFTDFFNEASRRGIPFTIHAGEARGAESVIDSINLGAKRLGHGIRSYESKEALELIKSKNICLECCPKSNFDTNAIENFNEYPIRFYLDNGIDVTLSSDNRTVSDTNLDFEVEFLQKYLKITEEDIYRMNINGVKHAFISDNEKEKLISILEKER